MRMWGVHPDTLCTAHLLGEHVEMHMFRGTIAQGKSIAGYLTKGLVVPELIHRRHDELAVEMQARGYSHSSPYAPLTIPDRWLRLADPVGLEPFGRAALHRRCPDCRARWESRVQAL